MAKALIDIICLVSEHSRRYSLPDMKLCLITIKSHSKLILSGYNQTKILYSNYGEAHPCIFDLGDYSDCCITRKTLDVFESSRYSVRPLLALPRHRCYNHCDAQRSKCPLLLCDLACKIDLMSTDTQVFFKENPHKLLGI